MTQEELYEQQKRLVLRPVSKQVKNYHRHRAIKKLEDLMLRCRNMDGMFIVEAANIQFPDIEESIRKSFGLYDEELD